MAVIVAGSTSAFGIGFTDTFDSIDPAWATDRAEPAGFTVENFDGDNRLRLDISGSDHRPVAQQFYNTQGRQRQASVTGPWQLSGQLYISQSMYDGSLGDWATSLWGRTSPDGTEANADYPIIRIQNIGGTLTSLVWDGDIGYVDTGSSALQVGWNQLDIFGLASSYGFEANGSSLYTDSTVTSSEDFTTAFIQGHNLNGTDSRTYYWDNVSVSSTSSSVPDTGPGLAGIGALGSIIIVGSRFNRRQAAA